jgi:hypothetical protein
MTMAEHGSSWDQDCPGGASGVTVMTRGAVRYRDGRIGIVDMLGRERVHLRRAGFCPYQLTLERHDGSRLCSELWMQEEPTLADYLNAAHLLFNDEPGSVHWDSPAATASRA